MSGRSMDYLESKDHPVLRLDKANVDRARAFRGLFDLELDFLILFQGVEIGLDDAVPVEENLSPVRGTDETESPIADQLLDFPCLHFVSPL